MILKLKFKATAKSIPIKTPFFQLIRTLKRIRSILKSKKIDLKNRNRNKLKKHINFNLEMKVSP